MPARGLARLDELDRLARAHGWQVARYEVAAQDLPTGCTEAHGWMAAKRIDDGRDFSVIIVYGKAAQGRWQLVRDDGKYPVICSVDEPTLVSLDADTTLRFTSIATIEHWIPQLDQLIDHLRSEGTLPERQTMQQRLRKAERRH